MAYITLLQPERTKSGLEAFTEGASPYLQLAFQSMLQRQIADRERQKQMEMQEMQRQQDIQQATELGLFQPQYEQAGRDIAGQGLKYPQMLQPQEQSKFYSDIGKKKYQGKSVPDKYLKFSPEGAKTLPPGFQIPLGRMQYNVPQPLAPTYIYNPTTGKVEPMTLPTGEPIPPKAKVITQPETPEEKQRREVETAAQKKAQEVGSEMQSIDNMINVVWQKANELIPAQEDLSKATQQGIGRKIGTTIPGRLAGIGDENAIAYSEFQEGTLSMLIRSLGEKGMLTDQDIKRARQFEPGFYDTPKIRSLKRQSMTDFLKSKIQAYTQGEGNIQQTQQPIQQPPQGQEDFSQMSDEELRIIASGG